MNPKGRMCADTWTESSSGETYLQTNYKSVEQKWEESAFKDYGIRMEHISDFNQPSKPGNSITCIDNVQNQIGDLGHTSEIRDSNNIQNWDPIVILSNLSFLEKKIHRIQDLVHLIMGRRGQVIDRPDELLLHEQFVTADLTSIIAQLISTAGSLLPSVNHIVSSTNLISHVGQLGSMTHPSSTGVENVILLNSFENKETDQSKQPDITGFRQSEQNHSFEDQEMKSDDDVDEGENLPFGSYEIMQLEKEEILAPHTHFCTICGKGFKRDANLRMHMRGHGDEYKNPAALAKPSKESSSQPILVKRYSCPYIGCKRNKDHKKFQPLKTILCVKNHYKRTHCDKTYTCSRCNTKKFSVLADLKTHEKHCGRDKWLCSCGTTFSRKDKLFGHITLFQGHTPAVAVKESIFFSLRADQGQSSEIRNKFDQIASDYQSNAQTIVSFENIADGKGSGEDPANYFSPSCFETSCIDGFHEFPQPPYEDPENSLSFLLSGTFDCPSKN